VRQVPEQIAATTGDKKSWARMDFVLASNGPTPRSPHLQPCQGPFWAKVLLKAACLLVHSGAAAPACLGRSFKSPHRADKRAAGFPGKTPARFE
jgi:hypothetical protein